MDGVGHSDFHRAHLLRAALVHGSCCFDPLFSEPDAGFEDGDHSGAEFLRQWHHVVDVIEMAVRYEDCVAALNFEAFWINGIALRPRIEDERFAAGAR